VHDWELDKKEASWGKEHEKDQQLVKEVQQGGA
jgi:hypothetical protein